MILRMAFRNIFRHKSRSILTMITMIVGIFLAIIGEGINSGLENQVKDIYIKTELADYKLYSKGFHQDKIDNDQLEFPIENSAEVMTILSKYKNSPRISFQGSVTDGLEELSVDILGVDKKLENSVFNRSGYMSSGVFLDNPEGIVVGSELFKLLKLKLGDQLTVIARTAQNRINAYDLTVDGVIQTGNPFLDSRLVFIDIKLAEQFADTTSVNDIAVRGELSFDEIKKIEDLGVEAISWRDEIKGVLEITRIRRRAFAIISFTILLMAGVGIANTMIMAMMERQKEIGIMMANGMPRKDILILFLGEGSIVGLIGSFLGFVMGTIFVLHFQKEGIPIDLDTADLGMSIPISEKLYTYFNLSRSLIFMFIGVLISILAILYPSIKSTKLNPVEVIRD